jgi:hypothetical protein
MCKLFSHTVYACRQPLQRLHELAGGGGGVETELCPIRLQPLNHLVWRHITAEQVVALHSVSISFYLNGVAREREVRIRCIVVRRGESTYKNDW